MQNNKEFIDANPWIIAKILLLVEPKDLGAPAHF